MANVLVVDGDKNVLGYYDAVLGDHHEVMRISAGEDALKQLGHCDIVITGNELDGNINGLWLCEAIKKERPKMPVIMITGGAVSEDCKADKIFCKPIRPELLRAIAMVFTSN